jgi:hypothetical protein
MNARKFSMTVSVIALCIGCGCKQQLSAKTPLVGSESWCDEVDKILAISDPAGHGPDNASEEWCRAVHKGLAAELAPLSIDAAGSAEWYSRVDDVVFSLRGNKTKRDRR